MINLEWVSQPHFAKDNKVSEPRLVMRNKKSGIEMGIVMAEYLFRN